MTAPSFLTPLLALWLLATGCASSTPLPPKAVQLNDSGAQALAEGDLDTASARLDLALEYNPEFVEALVNLSLVEIQRRNYDRAEQLAERAKRLNPDFAQVHHALGVLEEHRNDPQLAGEHYRAALAVDPGFAESRANLGRLLLNDGHINPALEQFRKLRETNPESVLGHRGFVESLLRSKRNNEATVALFKAQAQFPDDPGLAILSGRLELEQGHFALAATQLAAVARRNDDFGATANAWLSLLSSMQSNFAVAAKHARTSLEFDAQHAVATYAMAIARHRQAAPDAEAWARRALALNPSNPVLREMLSQK